MVIIFLLRRLFHRRCASKFDCLIPVFIFVPVVIVQVYFATSAHIYISNELNGSAKFLHFYDALMIFNDLKIGDIKPADLDASMERRKGFGACLMVKDDNDLLYEWIAYHYTVLPLKYLVVGSDIHSTQDPSIVLQRWAQANISDLHFWILQPSDFIYRHGNNSNTALLNGEPLDPENTELWKVYHHHLFVDRQKAFVTTCTEILKEEGVDWTLYIDTDEFFVWNPWTELDEMTNWKADGSGSDSISSKSLGIRKEFTFPSSLGHDKQFHTLIQQLQSREDISDCYTLPRLLVGALENRTCPVQFEVQEVQALARKQLHKRAEHLSTLRYFQHAKKGDFSRSKFGKVMMDLSKISDETIRSERPRNIHRPYPSHCGPAGGVHFPNAYFFLLHYMGSWERYSSRNDHRRDRMEWERRAFVDDDMSACASTVPHWYLQFCRHVGEGRTPFLLGSDVR